MVEVQAWGRELPVKVGQSVPNYNSSEYLSETFLPSSLGGLCSY